MSDMTWVVISVAIAGFISACITSYLWKMRENIHWIMWLLGSPFVVTAGTIFMLSASLVFEFFNYCLDLDSGLPPVWGLLFLGLPILIVTVGGWILGDKLKI